MKTLKPNPFITSVSINLSLRSILLVNTFVLFCCLLLSIYTFLKFESKRTLIYPSVNRINVKKQDLFSSINNFRNQDFHDQSLGKISQIKEQADAKYGFLDLNYFNEDIRSMSSNGIKKKQSSIKKADTYPLLPELSIAKELIERYIRIMEGEKINKVNDSKFIENHSSVSLNNRIKQISSVENHLNPITKVSKKEVKIDSIKFIENNSCDINIKTITKSKENNSIQNVLNSKVRLKFIVQSVHSKTKSKQFLFKVTKYDKEK